jgi:copper chaperone NosL
VLVTKIRRPAGSCQRNYRKRDLQSGWYDAGGLSGTKAQIKYEGEKDVAFCDTIEFFMRCSRLSRRKIESMYVQDMGKANWDNPREYWMEPSNGYYVVGSKRQGSMGPTIASFSQEADAKKYMSEWGGKLLRFKEINKGMVDLSGGAARRKM